MHYHVFVWRKLITYWHFVIFMVCVVNSEALRRCWASRRHLLL